MTDTAAYKQYNLISYILHLLGFFLGITPLIAIIMNYIKRDERRGTWLESHVDWQIKTFWFSLLGYILGGLLTVILIGFVIIFLVFVWHVYRLVKGLIALNENNPIGT